MTIILERLAAYKQQVYLVVFLGLVSAPIVLYWAAEAGRSGLIWVLFVLLGLANAVTILTR